jgi:hypothetical protein
VSFGPDTHNDVVRFAWTLRPDTGGEPVAVGVGVGVGVDFDFATVDADGRLRNVAGFLETT